jgi:hypothetical protein
MNQTTKIMKKLALISFLIPALLEAQTYQKDIDLKWKKDLVSFRDSIGKSISKDSSLDSIAKDRFYKISNFLLQNPDVSLIEFQQKFSEGKHGIPSMGLESFDRQNSQEIATYMSSSKPRLDVLSAYKESKYHFEVVKGEIKRIQRISKSSNGKLSFESKEIVISNKRFGSYSGSVQRFVTREGKKYLEIITFNVSIFE